MRHENLFRFALPLLLVAICVRTSGSTLIINEVMANPSGDDDYDEFIELYNCGDSAIALSGYYLKINDYTDTLSFVVDYGDTIQSNGFALIMDRGYLVENKSSSYEDLIPDSALLITIQDNSLARTGLVNTAASQIYLFSPQRDTVSAVLTTAKPSSGYSWEKIITEGDNHISNWADSRILHGTPGFRNSVTPLPFDLEVTQLTCLSDPELLETGKAIDFSIIVKNIGENFCDSALILFGEDSNGDSILSSGETLFSTSTGLTPKDSIAILTNAVFNRAGIHHLIGDVIFPPDDEPGNNRQILDVQLPFPTHCLAINEFMYYPASGSGGEWIELLNISTDTINLRKWTIGDNSTTASLTKTDYLLPPNEFVVIANDSSFLRFWGSPAHFLKSIQPIPALNNMSDSILVNDLCGRRIDGLGYSKTWGYRTNFSLERKNPFTLSNSSSNWALSSSSEGGTPGQPNANLLKSLDLRWDKSNTFLKKDRLLPGESLGITFCIENNGLETVPEFQISFDFLSDTTTSAMPVTFYDKFFSDSIVSLQKIRDSLSVPIDFMGSGFIRGKILFPDADSANNLNILPVQIGYPAQTIVINEFMCQPESGNAEW
ncbi:MAG: lamin tail domain-containing protein, partial [Candidatus Neomarinimicrobiota bacterium]